MHKKIVIEVCCASTDDALAAQKGGADRIELNSALPLGGLTPSAGLLTECKKAVSIPVIAMVRPRAGGFCYTKNEVKTMLRDAEILLGCGADGIAFGFLNADGSVDTDLCKQMTALALGRDTVFSRAFDVTPDALAAAADLERAGVKRVLTSGQKQKAEEGKDTIKRLCGSLKSLEVLLCGGVRASNVTQLLQYTGCNQVHFALPKVYKDGSMPQNSGIKFCTPFDESTYGITDADGVAQIVSLVRGGL